MIGNKPVLEYFVHTHPELPLTVTGAIFRPDKYGFGLPQQSPLTRPLSVEVVGAYESGLLKELRTNYFGDNP